MKGEGQRKFSFRYERGKGGERAADKSQLIPSSVVLSNRHSPLLVKRLWPIVDIVQRRLYYSILYIIASFHRPDDTLVVETINGEQINRTRGKGISRLHARREIYVGDAGAGST